MNKQRVAIWIVCALDIFLLIAIIWMTAAANKTVKGVITYCPEENINNNLCLKSQNNIYYIAINNNFAGDVFLSLRDDWYNQNFGLEVSLKGKVKKNNGRQELIVDAGQMR